MAIKIDHFENFRLNENVNADDTQIALEAIRRGHKAIILDSLNFKEGHMMKKKFNQGLRRSQGLFRVLISNYDLFFKLKGLRSKSAYLNSLLLHTVVPWASIVLLAVSILGILIGRFSSHQVWMDLLIAGSLVTLPQGRSLLWGSTISVLSQIQYVVGINYSTWDPETQ